MRFGIGYDLHRLVEGRPLILGGIRIPFEKGLFGHSDADALSHAIIDALLGAAAMGDIGQLFPDSDSQYEHANSLELLHSVAQMLTQRGYYVNNIDSIIIAQSPKMAPHIPEMRKKIASKLGIDIECVSIKAKTNEGCDAIGNGEAIAAWVIATIERTAIEFPAGSRNAKKFACDS